MIRPDFEHLSALQLRIRSLEKLVEELKSGEKYRRLEEEYRALVRFHNKEVKRLEYELSKAHAETVTVRRYWGEVMDELYKEHRDEVEKLKGMIRRLEERALSLECQRDEAKDRLKERTKQYYTVSGELEEEREKNRKLTAQVNKDFENSSLPSSLQKPGRKRIPNSRVRTGKRPEASRDMKDTDAGGMSPQRAMRYRPRLSMHRVLIIMRPVRSSANRRSSLSWVSG